MRSAAKAASGPYVLLAFLSFPALPHRIGIVSEDKKYKAVVMVVPDPIVAKDKGCSVEVIRVREDFILPSFAAKDFTHMTRSNTCSNSEGEVMKGTLTADWLGEFSMGFGPGVKGKRTGTDRLSFEAPDCAPTVSYRWAPFGE